MADRLKNIVVANPLPVGVTVLPHGLNISGRGVIPDIFAPDTAGGLSFALDDTNVTITNAGVATTCAVYVEYFHSFNRNFGPFGTLTLPIAPFEIGGAGANATLAQAYLNGGAGGQVIALDTTRDGIFIRYTPGILAEAALAVQNAAGTVNYFRVDGGAAQDADAQVAIIANLSVTTTVGAGGTGPNANLVIFQGVAHTGLTASTEVTQFRMNFAQTRTWATGNFALQRTVRLDAETLSAAGASTVDDAVSFYVTGPPIAGAPLVITRSWAGWFGGNIRITSAGDIRGQAVTTSNAGSAAWSVTNDTGGYSGFLITYGSAVAGSQFGVNVASAVFLFTTAGATALAIGTLSAINLTLGTNDIARLQLRAAAEGAKATQVYISENGTLKQITIGANGTGGAGFSVLRVID